MSSQAEQLQQTMAFFKLGHSAAPLAAPRSSAPRASQRSVIAPPSKVHAKKASPSNHGTNGFALNAGAALDETQFARF
jgi:methyl-accepting chemotaxis protein